MWGRGVIEYKTLERIIVLWRLLKTQRVPLNKSWWKYTDEIKLHNKYINIHVRCDLGEIYLVYSWTDDIVRLSRTESLFISFQPSFSFILCPSSDVDKFLFCLTDKAIESNMQLRYKNLNVAKNVIPINTKRYLKILHDKICFTNTFRGKYVML